MEAKPPAITPEQIAAIESFREKVKNLMAPLRVDKGGVCIVLLTLSTTPKGRPEITIDTNAEKHEAAATLHLARLLLPQLDGAPNTIEQAGAMMAGRDPRTGARLLPGGGQIIVE